MICIHKLLVGALLNTQSFIVSRFAVILYSFQLAHPYNIHWSLCEHNLVMWPSPCESDIFFLWVFLSTLQLGMVIAFVLGPVLVGSPYYLYQWSLWEYFISHPTFHSVVHGMESHHSKTALLLLHGTNCSGNTCGHICWYVPLSFSLCCFSEQLSVCCVIVLF